MVRAVTKTGDTIVSTQENWYNGNGQRIGKTEVTGKDTSSPSTETTRYFYDGTTVLYTTDENGALTTKNLLGLSDNAIATRRYSDDYKDQNYFYLKDIRGSVTSIVDEAMEGVGSYEYDDFGVTTVNGDEGFENQICYTGGIYDGVTGLYYLNARYYDPEDGRFLTEDTYRGEVDNPDTWHMYVYCANNPINYTDPSGHARRKSVLYDNSRYYLQEDITIRLNNYMKKNAKTLAEKMRRAKKIKNIAKRGKEVINVYKYFIEKVKTKGDWDLKVKSGWKLRKGYYYSFRGKNYFRNDAVGNIHFGYVGAVLFNKQVLCAGAGVYQIKSGTSKLEYYKSWGDDPYDNLMIRTGYNCYIKDKIIKISIKDIKIKKK